MSALLGWPLTATGVVLMFAGLVTLWSSVALPVRRRPARAHRPGGGLPVALVCTTVVGGVIAAVEWLILSRTTPGAVWVLVLAVPALFAAATVARLVVIARTPHPHRPWRAIRSGRRWRR